MTSPFEVLGVSRDADDDTIRAAFRRAAKACHPDLNDGDEAAARQFKQIAAARDAIIKGARLRADVNRPLLASPRELEERKFEADEFDHPFDYPPLRARPGITVRGVIFALLAAWMISSVMVFLSQRGVTAFEGAIAGVLVAKDLVTKTLVTKNLVMKNPATKNEDISAREIPASAVLHQISTDPQDAAPPDGDLQIHTSLEASVVPPSPPRDEPSHAPVAVTAKLPGIGRDPHKGAGAAARAGDHRTTKRAPSAVVVATRNSEGHASNGAAPPDRAAVARVVPPPAVAARPTLPPERGPVRPARPLSGCWTEEGHGRWLPCETGGD